MLSSTAVALKSRRTLLRVSQSGLSRLAQVPRWKINSFEFGDDSLSSDELSRIREALQAEAQRLRALSDNFECAKELTPAS